MLGSGARVRVRVRGRGLGKGLLSEARQALETQVFVTAAQQVGASNRLGEDKGEGVGEGQEG